MSNNEVLTKQEFAEGCRIITEELNKRADEYKKECEQEVQAHKPNRIQLDLWLKGEKYDKTLGIPDNYLLIIAIVYFCIMVICLSVVIITADYSRCGQVYDVTNVKIDDQNEGATND
jgi:hypothetical protein